MLLTLVAYFIYLKYRKEGRDTSDLSLYDIVKEEGYILAWIAILNIAMLGFGFLGEIKKMPMLTSVFFGFIAFVATLQFMKNTYLLYRICLVILYICCIMGSLWHFGYVTIH